MDKILQRSPMDSRRAPMDNTTVILKRTFNQKTWNQDGQQTGSIRFWRVMSKGHKSYQSDLSIEGLKDWGII